MPLVLTWYQCSSSHITTVKDVFAILVSSADPAALTRIALEFWEDSAQNGVAYFEARFSPHLVCNPERAAEVKPEHMVKAVIEGFRQGEKKFGVKVFEWFWD